MWVSTSTCKKIGLWFLILGLLFLDLTSPSFAAPNFYISNLEQQINIINGEFSTTGFTDSPTDNGLGLIHFDGANYNSEVVYFEAVIRCSGCTGGNTEADVSLYNDSGNVQTTIATTSSSYVRVRSGSLVLPSDDYTVRMKVDATAGTAYVKSARLIIIQNSTITATESQYEIGHYVSSTNTSATSLSEPKRYLFDADQFDGTVNAYFEASLKTNGNDASPSYYFDAHDIGEEWSTNPTNMEDNNTANYASTTTDGEVQLLNRSDATATDLGQINKVEVRAFGYQTNGADGDIFLRPVFSGTNDGDNHTFTPSQGSGSAGWSGYFDITNDTNAPSTWDWTEVDNLDLDVEFSQGALLINEAFISKVEVRVSYERNDILAYAQLYNITDGTVVTTLSSFDNDYERVRSSALTTNWDTSNDDEYELRLYTSNGANAVNLANAKVVINQSDATGLQRTEVYHQQITDARTQTNTLYTQETFINHFEAATFGKTNVVKVFLDGTIKTTGGIGYLALYNSDAADIVDTPINSEVTTSSTSFERVRSADVGFNSDWITSQQEVTSIIKATSSQTTTVSNSVLVIQAQAIEPSFSFTINGVAAAQTNNGVTTTVTSTPTSIPFGSIDVSSPEFATHELIVTTNAASKGYSIYVTMRDQFQGYYPANNIDPFTGNAATWDGPQTWITPTGTTSNTDTGWFGAQTTDENVTGWSGTTAGKFGPLVEDVPTMVMTSSLRDTTETEYVSYGIEVNIEQPSDTYATVLRYDAVPVY